MLNERRRHLRDRLAAREALQAAHDELERKVQQRTADLSAANRLLQDEVAERTRAEATLRAAQDELVQAGKLAVIGQLSTGIAHELNQPLTALRTWPATASAFWSAATWTPRAPTWSAWPSWPTAWAASPASCALARKSAAAAARAAGPGAGQCAGRAGARIRASRPRCCAMRTRPAWRAVRRQRLEQVLINLIGNALDARGRAQPHRAALRPARRARADRGARPRPRPAGRRRPTCSSPSSPPSRPATAWAWAWPCRPASCANSGQLGGANHPEGGAVFTLELPLAPAPPAPPCPDR
jgi:two-component system C4-dicarboxylate transport sensor histidine kinase DctB